jgi:hypothetical protein
MNASKKNAIGPFETRQQARQAPAVQAVYAAFDADPGPGKMTPLNIAMLADACSAAEVTLGEFDRHTLGWVAGFDATSVVVIAGLIRRAADGPDVAPAAIEPAEHLGGTYGSDEPVMFQPDVPAWVKTCDRPGCVLTGEHQHGGAHLDQADRQTVLSALARAAMTCHHGVANCPACDIAEDAAAEPCGACAGRLAWIGAYDAVAAKLRGQS